MGTTWNWEQDDRNYKNQQYQELFLAVVIDTRRTVSAGEVEIGAFLNVNDCVKTNYNQMESDEPRDDNSMDYSDQKELSDEYYTKKFRKVNKEDRRDDDKLRRHVS
ncbi:hypothetical protein Tco_1290065 [Tanacetum coccineum]